MCNIYQNVELKNWCWNKSTRIVIVVIRRLKKAHWIKEKSLRGREKEIGRRVKNFMERGWEKEIRREEVRRREEERRREKERREKDWGREKRIGIK